MQPKKDNIILGQNSAILATVFGGHGEWSPTSFGKHLLQLELFWILNKTLLKSSLFGPISYLVTLKKKSNEPSERSFFLPIKTEEKLRTGKKQRR